jgi:hypothetical protein
MSTRIVLLEPWDRVRARFSDAERAQLNRAIVGHVVCPDGVSIELRMLPASLADKLHAELASVAR